MTVSGVRSSWLALATKRRWASTAPLDAVEHRVEGVGRARRSRRAGPVGRDARVEPVVGDAARRASAIARIGASARPAASQPTPSGHQRRPDDGEHVLHASWPSTASAYGAGSVRSRWPASSHQLSTSSTSRWRPEQPDVEQREPQAARGPRASHAVAGARHRLDHGGLAELAAQLHDRHPHRVGERVDVLVPDALEQLLGGRRRRRRRPSAPRARRTPCGESSRSAPPRVAVRRAGSSSRSPRREHRRPRRAGRGARARARARRARRSGTAWRGSRRRRARAPRRARRSSARAVSIRIFVSGCSALSVRHTSSPWTAGRSRSSSDDVVGVDARLVERLRRRRPRRRPPRRGGAARARSRRRRAARPRRSGGARATPGLLVAARAVARPVPRRASTRRYPRSGCAGPARRRPARSRSIPTTPPAATP